MIHVYVNVCMYIHMSVQENIQNINAVESTYYLRMTKQLARVRMYMVDVYVCVCNHICAYRYMYMSIKVFRS